MANHICLTSLAFSVLCALICWLVSPGLVKWLGAEGNIYKYGLTYIRIVVLDLPFLFTINLFTSVKQSQGDTVKPMLLNMFGVVINLILDPLFLMVFNGVSVVLPLQLSLPKFHVQLLHLLYLQDQDSLSELISGDLSLIKARWVRL